MTTPAQSRQYARMVRDFTLSEGKAYNEHLLAGKKSEDFFDKMEKHLPGQHEQKDHGTWADGDGNDSGGYVSGKDLINGNFNDPMLISEGGFWSPFNPPEKRKDEALDAIIKKQGFDGNAQLVDQEQFDAIIKAGGIERYRGVSDYTDANGNLVTGNDIVTQFAEGKYRSGLGVSGNGIYTTDRINTAKQYADMEGNGKVIKVAILPSAKIATIDQVDLAISHMRDPENSSFLELGRIMAAQGFDGYIASGNALPSTIMLNRTAMAVLKP